jgi:sacsin
MDPGGGPSDGHTFGQRQPPLYVTIQKILDKYPDGQIFKEIIQNADDAGASTVHFYLDSRQHGSQSLIYPSIGQFQGPSLLSYNDAMFQAKDWQSIQDMQQSVKAEDPFKVGKFGIGFNSVYHITDLPTIVSGNRLAYLDPHEEIWPRQTGQWYEINQNAHCSDTFVPFEGLCGFSVRNRSYNGTLFRFPLRNVSRAKRVSSHTYDINKLRNLLGALRGEAQCILLFLRSVRSVKVFEIGGSGEHSNILDIGISEVSPLKELSQTHAIFQANLKMRFEAQSYGISKMLNDVVHVQVDVNDYQTRATGSSKWLVATQVGSQSEEVRRLAKELKAFPWVGVALETSASSSGGRVYCVLPMPLEVTCNLPVHVNGTFSLNDERRELKWRTIERRNDPSAQWNHLLVRELLPPCYAMLLLDHAKILLEPDRFCQAWPDTSKVTGTPWQEILTPLLRTLFSSEVIPFSTPGGFHTWIKVNSAIFVPRGVTLHAAVKTALVACGVKLVAVKDRIWNALKFSNIAHATVSASLARAELRKTPNSYTSLSREQKLELLRYCLSDNQYGDMQNLALLPLANGTFTSYVFGIYRNSAVYLCTAQCPRHLLPSLEGELVDDSIDPQIYAKLNAIASELYNSNLHVLTVQSVASLLARVLPNQNKIYLPYSKFDMQWLERLWYWIPGESLHLFQNLPLVPVGESTVVMRLSKASAVLFIPSNTQNYGNPLISALQKLGVECCLQKRHPFVHHRSIHSVMNIFSPEGIIGAIQAASPSYHSISFTGDEAAELIMQVHNTRGLNYQQQAILKEIPMFTTLQNKLSSVAQVESSTGRGAQVEPPSFPLSAENLPQSVVLFSGSGFYQKPLLQNLSVHCTTTVDVLTSLVFPEIERGALGRNAAKKIMKEVLEKYNVITSSIGHRSVEALQKAIATLPFVPVSSGKPKTPNILYTPLDPELSNLFFQESVFPLDPFAGGKYVKILKLCGLKTFVSKQEIVDIISSIGYPGSNDPVRADEVRGTRAKAVLTYIKRWEHQLNENVYIVAHSRHHHQRSLQFSQALRELSVTKCWLPVQSSPPRKYPSCLTWKGSGCDSHFVSFGSSVLLHKEQTSLALACGSQMYLVEHSLPNAICKAFEPAPEDMVRHIMAHLETVILSCEQFSKTEEIRSVTHTIYVWLNKYTSEGHTVDLSQLEETQDCVWLTRQRKFVHPRNVALAQNPEFRHNLEPFVYILPDDLAQFECLFKDLGVQEMVTREQILGILPAIKEGDSHSLGISSEQAWQLVMAVLHWLTESEEGEIVDIDFEDLLVPVQSDETWPQLVVGEGVVYTDNNFLQDYLSNSEDNEADYTFVHSKIIPQMAYQLQLTPLSQHLNISEDAFEDVGQSEPLTVRLRNILKDYKDGLTIIKELLQNADDAGATEMNICYDKRCHTDNRRCLFFPGMVECHGPALVVNNNAMFTEKDFVNITKLAGATKEGQSLKIGKFGIGFCSVYHITDVPSFVSSDLLYIFDPTLKYLKNEIKNLARPGKKLCFTSRFISRSKQLEPYVGLFDFDPAVPYEGTTFRFPFRTTVSELSEKIYTDHDIKQLMEQIQKSNSKLVLFLQNIDSITFSKVNRGQKQPKELMRITKNTETLAEGRCIHSITCSVNGSADVTEYWLVETSSQIVLQKYSTASVACSLTLIRDQECYKTPKIEGEIFCFLPLSIKTGLPVHVSSNFAVINNRRGIWTSDESDSARSEEVKWNVSLMKTVICSAYCGLLEALKELQSDSKLEEYKYFSIWPVEEELLVYNPWHYFVEELYRSIAERDLFFSDSTDRWLTLDDSKFLDPDILRVSYNSPFPSAVLEIVKHIELPVVHLPKKYHEHLDLAKSIETEKTFLEHFFDTIDQLEDVLESRNDVLCLALECYASELDRKNERFSYLQELLKGNACIPCAPDGVELKRPEELIHPSAEFAQLFDVDENVFPLQHFCDKVFVDRAMKELGIVHDSIPLKLLEDRASGIAELYKEEKLKAMERAQLIVKCLEKEDKRETFSSEKCSKLSQIPFLPVMEKPENYLLQWKGEKDTLHRGCDIFRSGRLKDDATNISLAGSQLVFLNQEPPSQGGCGIVSLRAQTLLQIRLSPSYAAVISHFHHLIDTFEESKEMIELADRTSRKVYEFLEKLLAEGSEESEEVGPCLAEKPCIWTGRKFVECKAVAMKWNHNGPYLFKVPPSLDRRKYLKKALGIREQFDVEDMVVALRCLKGDFGENQLPDSCQELVKSIVMHMASVPPERDFGPVMLPDTQFILHEAKKLYHNDMPWVPHDDDYCYVHQTVPLGAAVALGVQLCRTASLAKYSVDSELMVMEFGQHEDLTKRIQNIIRDYPFDMTILKELLQNADDAKATKMHVILDMREHSKEHLLSENWSELQGPALLVWNDSVFSEKDLIGIQRLGLGSKRSDSETIGQYGIGFNAVYHLTDCPSFLTGGNTLCILDPHMKYVPQATDRHPGAMYGNLDEKFWDSFDGLKSAYLLEKVKKKPEELVGGTLFRFPLRYNKKLVKSSDIVRELKENLDDLVLTGEKLHGLLLKWAPSMKKSLLFLNNVTELRFFVVRGRGVLELENTYRAELCEIAMENRKELTANLKTFATQEPTRPFVTCYPLTIVESAKGGERKERWLVQQGIGDIQEGVKTWKYVEQVKPRHGLAASLSRRREEPFVGEVFCFLPLPLSSKLPVHINGHFILNSTRRNLWVPTDDKGDDKSRWNENILQAIASSYAKFLELIPEYFPNIKGCNRRDFLVESLRDYYLCFPSSSGQEPLSEPWLTLAQQVYKVMSACNSPVLAVPTKKSLRSSKDKYILQWRPLKSDQMPGSQVHFWTDVADEESENDKIKSILERIGMKITYAPLWILHRFQKAELEIPSVSPESVFNFYSLFNQAFIAGNYPVQIEQTPFQCVGDFKSFTDFLLDEEQCTFPKEPFGQPLLLNADNQLCIFDQANKILCSKYTRLFPQSPDRFLHEQLIECSYSQSYFLSVVDPERVEIVKELIETILPAKLKNRYVSAEDEEVNMAEVKLLWECFSHDEVFKSVLDEVLKVWALLLTKDRRLFRCESDDQLLPIALQDDTVLPPPDIASEIEQVFKGPFIDTEIVPAEIACTFCPQLSEYARILKNLFYLHREFPFSEVMTVQIASKLFKYFSNIHFKKMRECCTHLKSLPLFETISGTLTAIEGRRVYIWPKGICKKGAEKWLRGTDLVFLKPKHEWRNLGVDDFLGIKTISAEQTYVRFIFPVFSTLNESERYAHLSHIRDVLFDTNFVIQKNDSSANHFVSQLTNLPCIGKDGKTLQPVKNFHTHKKVIFRTFPEHFQMLPDQFRKEEDLWMEFFMQIGLQKNVTSEVFITLCNDVAGGKMKERTKASSKVLLDYLFSKQEAKFHEFHSDTNLLAKISDIPFVYQPQLPELEWIKKVPQAPNCLVLGSGEKLPLCKLAGSCTEHFKDLVWAVKTIVSVKDNNKDLHKNLGICEPTAEDVLLNLTVLTKTCFADRNQFMKYTAPHCQQGHSELMDVMAMIFERLQQSPELEVDELKSLPCIPVYAMFDDKGGQFPVLVKPNCVVFRPTEITRPFYPFIHSLQRPLHRASEFLERLGVQNSIELRHMQIVLESAFTSAGSMELDPNTRKAVSVAMLKMESLLKENRDSPNLRMGEVALTENLTPLYLPGKDNRLHPTDMVVHSKIRGKINLEGTNLFLLWNPENMFPEVFSALLPKSIRPRPLSHLCTTQVSTTCKPCEDVPDFVSELKRTLMVPNLAQGMSLVVKSVALRDKERVGSVFLEHTTKFLDSLEIHCVKPLKIDLFLNDNMETKVASEPVWCYIEEKQQSSHLYIDRGIRSYSISDALDLIAKQLLSCLGDTDIPDLSTLQDFLAKMLRSNTTEDVYNFLQYHEVSCRELTNRVDIDHELTLGDPIPTSLHFRLDQSYHNIFQPQEFIAYQPLEEEERFIVAMVSHVVCFKDDSGKPLRPMHMEYKIFTSEEDRGGNGKRVKAIEIFKFIRGKTAPQEAPPGESDCQELVVFEGNPEDLPPPAAVATSATPAPIDIQKAKDEVREELEEIWRLPKEERKRAIHRLYLKWHPDKNPHNQDATEEVFKFLLQEFDRLERGAGPSISNESGTYSWRNFQHFWDSTARQHRQYHDEYQQQFSGGARPRRRQWHRGGASQFFFDEEYTPPRREREARQWVRQALVDEKALKTLLQEARIDATLSCHVCFLAHEVAEKALKGAMYATCGLRAELRENHNIIPLAHAIEQVKPEIANGLIALAQPLEPTYYEDTRFPKQNLSPSPPYEKFTLQNAEEAEACAAGILKIVKDIVET